MSKDNPDQLSAALRRIAGQSEPTAADPAAAVRQKARRLRTQRAAATAVIGAAAVALVVPMGITLFPDGRKQEANVATTTTATTDTPTPTPTPTPQATRGKDGVLERSIDLDKLPRGKAPQVPWYANGVIHDGQTAIRFRGDFTNINSMHKVRGGYLVLVDYEGEFTSSRELFLVKPNGQRQSLDRESGGGLIFEPAVSDDGTQVAWSRFGGEIGSRAETKLNVFDITAGEVTYAKEIFGGEASMLEARAFLGSKVLVNRATNALSKPVKIWDPQRGTLTDWHDSFDLAGHTPDGSLAAVITSGSRDEGCFAVLELPSKRQLWRSCEFNHNDVYFSRGNRYVASPNFDVDHEGTESAFRDGKKIEPPPPPKITSSLNIFTARTGEPVLRIKDHSPYQIAWESEDTLLFTAYTGPDKDPRQAIVRCTTTGACELATAVQSSKVHPPYAFAIQR
jgi:hypothetical protein